MQTHVPSSAAAQVVQNGGPLVLLGAKRSNTGVGGWCRGGCRCPAVLGCGGCVGEPSAAGGCCWDVAVSCLPSLFLLVTPSWSVAPCVLLLVLHLQAKVVGADTAAPTASWRCSVSCQGPCVSSMRCHNGGDACSGGPG